MTKVLLLGLGRWGVNHLRNLNSLPVELYVAEVGAKQLEPARKLGLPESQLTTNYKDFAAKADGIVIVTPAQTHFPRRPQSTDVRRSFSQMGTKPTSNVFILCARSIKPISGRTHSTLVVMISRIFITHLHDE